MPFTSLIIPTTEQPPRYIVDESNRFPSLEWSVGEDRMNHEKAASRIAQIACGRSVYFKNSGVFSHENDERRLWNVQVSPESVVTQEGYRLVPITDVDTSYQHNLDKTAAQTV